MKEQSFHVKSYGCQMNVYDSEKISSFLTKEGMVENNDIYSADIVIFNTCNIREKAAQKVYSDIGRVVKKNNDKVIAVVGCVAQAENSEMFNRSSDIDIILGPQSYHLLPKMIEDVKPHYKQLNTDFIINEKFDYLSEERKVRGISSFVTIQEGCDKFCAFCVVPFTRGPEYSRSIQDIKLEVLQLTKQGAREIVLLGQNVNAYNSEINENKNKLSDLIYELSEITDLKRIRYTTSHPINMTDDLIKSHKDNDKLMPFLHLPVQSGSNNILKKMNRKYSVEFYKEVILKLKEAKPNIQISSDFIIGFPEETNKDFEETLKLIDEIEFTQSYSFIYSERPGTKAASINDELSNSEKTERLKILQSRLQEIQFNFNKTFNNKFVKVLIENKSASNPEYFFGRTPYMQSVYIKSKKLEPGSEVDVQINSCNHKSLYANF